MWAIVRESDNRLMNIVMWDGESSWPVPAGCRIEPFDAAVHVWEVPVLEE